MRSRLRLIPALVLVLASLGFGARPAAAAEDIQGDIRTAVSVTRAFWASHWYDYFRVRYLPPRVLGGYNGYSPNRPACGGQPLRPYNAGYCAAGHYIAWDVNLMRLGYEYGDGWIYHVIAHEWGHAVQANLPPGLHWGRLELQADCFAGAALQGAADDGDLVWERGDTAEIQRILRLLSGDTPWTRPGDHGSVSQRMWAFRLGVRGGVPACVP
ncbi:hypothetical protein [Herbidospora sp. NBRC 101105]|uniref:hypothetical protein n=1 Tax=Herbidospora sp. NBRC 101105 TaxID=3032195 RepID=UPI0024A092A7|nr:hypothetical protein [Herbidospora sp. NBRC 101105]GLX93412.1 hypothetical protein Hesp01_13620 [Herbidospora sp. NBRC 101105]